MSKVWERFSLKDKANCADNQYRCLVWGTYSYVGSTYKCGCSNTTAEGGLI